MITKIVSKCINKISFCTGTLKIWTKKNKILLTSDLVQCHFDYGCSMSLNVIYWYDMSAQEEAPNYTKQSHLFYFRSSFWATHWPI